MAKQEVRSGRKNIFGGAHKARNEILSEFSVFIRDVFRKGSESVRYLIITIQCIDVVYRSRVEGKTMCHVPVQRSNCTQ